MSKNSIEVLRPEATSYWVSPPEADLLEKLGFPRVNGKIVIAKMPFQEVFVPKIRRSVGLVEVKGRSFGRAFVRQFDRRFTGQKLKASRDPHLPLP